MNIFASLQTIWAMARADGYKVAAFVITPNYNWLIDDPKWTEWASLNASIRQSGALYDWLVPMADVLIQSDLSDGLHPTVAGAQKLANLVSLNPVSE